MRKTSTALVALTAILASCPAAAERIQASEILADRDGRTPESGIRFMDAVPTYGHAGRIKAAEDAYQSQVDSARRARAATQMDAATSRAMEADKAAREATRSRVEKLGTPTSTFRSGAYESRTYQSGNTIQTIRMKNGKITGSSTYRTNR